MEFSSNTVPLISSVFHPLRNDVLIEQLHVGTDEKDCNASPPAHISSEQDPQSALKRVLQY
jgi:hypothetical protein